MPIRGSELLQAWFFKIKITFSIGKEDIGKMFWKNSECKEDIEKTF